MDNANPKIFNGMTAAQYERQQHRAAGKYAKVNPCYRCGKSAGVNYYSCRFTDAGDPSPYVWSDLGLVLCRKCCTFTDKKPDEAFAEIRAGKWANWPAGSPTLIHRLTYTRNQAP